MQKTLMIEQEKQKRIFYKDKKSEKCMWTQRVFIVFCQQNMKFSIIIGLVQESLKFQLLLNHQRISQNLSNQSISPMFHQQIQILLKFFLVLKMVTYFMPVSNTQSNKDFNVQINLQMYLILKDSDLFSILRLLKF